MRTILMLVLTACCFSGLAQKGDTLLAGSELPRWKNLAERNYQYSIYTMDKRGQLLFFSVMDRSVRPHPVNGKDTWVSIQTYHSKGSVDTDSTVYMARTYMPVSYRTQIPSEGHREEVDFEGSKIMARIIYKDSAVIRDQSVGTPVYSVVTDEDLFQALPWKEGYEITVPGVNPGAHFGKGKSYTTYKVIGEEDLSGPSGISIPCWKITSGPSTYWISKKNQELIRQQFTMSNGNTFWKMRM
jgi:hypothetical protein